MCTNEADPGDSPFTQLDTPESGALRQWTPVISNWITWSASWFHWPRTSHKLQFSQLPNQHGTTWAVRSTAQWADCFWECNASWTLFDIQWLQAKLIKNQTAIKRIRSTIKRRTCWPLNWSTSLLNVCSLIFPRDFPWIIRTYWLFWAYLFRACLKGTWMLIWVTLWVQNSCNRIQELPGNSISWYRIQRLNSLSIFQGLGSLDQSGLKKTYFWLAVIGIYGDL